MPLKIFILNVKMICVIWLHLSNVLENAMRSVMTESFQGWRMKHRKERKDYKEREGSWESGVYIRTLNVDMAL